MVAGMFVYQHRDLAVIALRQEPGELFRRVVDVDIVLR
jgi:hypothetical protein